MMNLFRVPNITTVLPFILASALFLLSVVPQIVWANTFGDQKKILVLGDSLSAGYGVEQGKEWVQLLANRLNQSAHSINVVNASISGDTTAGGLARLPALLEAESPTWVLIVLGGNDGLRGMSVKALNYNLQAMIDRVKQSGAEALLIGIRIPPNYGKKYTQLFERVFVDVAQQNQVPLLPFLIVGVAGQDQYMQADRIHPNVDAQPIIERDVWTFLKPILIGK